MTTANTMATSSPNPNPISNMADRAHQAVDIAAEKASPCSSARHRQRIALSTGSRRRRPGGAVGHRKRQADRCQVRRTDGSVQRLRARAAVRVDRRRSGDRLLHRPYYPLKRLHPLVTARRRGTPLEDACGVLPRGCIRLGAARRRILPEDACGVSPRGIRLGAARRRIGRSGPGSGDLAAFFAARLLLFRCGGLIHRGTLTGPKSNHDASRHVPSASSIERTSAALERGEHAFPMLP